MAVRFSIRVEGRLVGLFRPMGQSGGRFGTGYHKGSRLAQEDLSDGYVAWVQEPPTILEMSKFLPSVAAYTSEGALRWQRRIEDFTPQRFVDEYSSEGQATFRLDGREPGDQVLGITALPEGFVLIQIARIEAGVKESGGAAFANGTAISSPREMVAGPIWEAIFPRW